MKKPARHTAFRFDEFRRRRRRLIEYTNYPSELALDVWEYVIAIGTSLCPKGHNVLVGSDRNGYLLHYVQRGDLQHEVEGKIHTLVTGQACLLQYSKGLRNFNDHPTTTHLWYVLFDGKDMPRLFKELGAARDPVFSRLDGKRFETLFHELWELTARKPPAHEARSHAVLHALLAELFASRAERILMRSVIARKSDLSDKVRLAVDLIEQNYYMNLGLKQIQSVVGMDMYHLARKFRQEVSIAPIQYLNRYRVERAKRLLAASDQPVGEVARLVGIPNANYFARLFQKLVGKTPQSYRSKARQEIG